MLLSITASFCGAIYNIVTRKVGGRDRAETSLFYVGLVGALAAAVPLPVLWKTPEGMQWLLLGFMGVAGTIGHFMLIQAHRLAPASALAPFMYTQIVWMILVGYVVFRRRAGPLDAGGRGHRGGQRPVRLRRRGEEQHAVPASAGLNVRPAYRPS